MANGRMEAGGVNVFVLPRGELREMIQAHAANCRANAEKVRAELRDEEERAAGGGPVTQVKDVLKSAVEAFENKAKEADYLAEHLAPDEHFVMSAAHLLAFKASFGVIDINVNQLVLSYMTANKPEKQAERNLKSALVQVPRLVLPGYAEG